MDLATSILKFKQTVEKYIPRARFAVYSLDQLKPIQEALSLSPELMQWYQTAAPLNVHLPWNWLDLFICDPIVLIEKQGGYRWVWANHERLDTEWNPS